jgi:hypothetical protein
MSQLSERPPEPPKVPGEQHRLLDVFIGRWHAEGETFDELGTRHTMSSQNSYEWLPGGFFLVHLWHNTVDGSEIHRGEEIIGWDAANECYFSRFFDSLGNYREYRVDERGDTWTFAGKWERAEVAMSGDGMIIKWESTSDGKNWRALCDLKATRLH